MELSPELGAALVSLIVAGTGWLKSHSEVEAINQDRETVKANRDADSQKIHDDMIRLQCMVNNHDESIKVLFEQSVASSEAISKLNQQMAVVLERLDTVINTLKDIKEKQ